MRLTPAASSTPLARALLPEPRVLVEHDLPPLRVALPVGRQSYELGIALSRGDLRWPVSESGLAAAASQLDLPGLPDTLDPGEGFLLGVRSGGITVGAETPSGRFYALQALAQMAATAARATPAGDAVDLPAVTLVDWPAGGLRGAHACYHLVQPFLPYHGLTYEALVERVHQLAHYRVNTLLLELESVFPFRRHPEISAPFAFSREQVAALAGECRRCGVEVIPMVQCLGHAYNVLRHAAYAHLREGAETTQQYCPSNPDARAFFLELVDDVLDVLGPVRLFHMGGDETRRLGVCPACRDRVAAEGVAALYGRHVGELCQALLGRGLSPIVWSDMMEHHPEAERFLPDGTVIMYWNYSPFRWPRPQLLQHFTREGRGASVIGASGARFGGLNNTMYDYATAMGGIATMADLCRRNACRGSLVTDWTKAIATDLTLPSLVYGATCAWGDGGSLDDFAHRFAQLHFGRAWDWQRVYALLTPRVPYLEDAGAHQGDNVDRFDLSANTFAQRVVEYTRQTSRSGGVLGEAPRDVRREVIGSLQTAAERAEQAGVILEAALAGGPLSPHAALLWAHLDVARRSQSHAAHLGLAVDEAVRLLKFPLPDEAARRAAVADQLDALTAAAAALRDECRALLARTTFEPVAATIVELRFPRQADDILRSWSEDLRAGNQRSALLPA
jgi:hypothetical protein